jgi:hypothetical protein
MKLRPVSSKPRLWLTVSVALRFRSAKAARCAAVIPGVGLLASWLAGCGRSPQVVHVRDATILPGRGLTNVCEVGMTYGRVSKLFCDSRISKSSEIGRVVGEDSRFLTVPALGVTGVIQTDDTLSHIMFHTVPFQHPDLRGMRIETPFQGRLGERLDFGKEAVSRANLEAALGTLSHGSTNPSDYAALWVERKPFWISRGSAREDICYENLGVTFMLKSNRVTSFTVYTPITVPMQLPGRRSTQP